MNRCFAAWEKPLEKRENCRTTAAQQNETVDSVRCCDTGKQKEEMNMENRPIIKKEQVETVYDSRFIKVFDLQYEPGKHYFDATRRVKDNLAAVKSDEEFQKMLPDAVSCVVILKIKGQEPRLCLSREYRYPAGQFLLSVPAGLLDPEDAAQENPVFHAAIRELREEILQFSDNIYDLLLCILDILQTDRTHKLHVLFDHRCQTG